MNIPFVDLQAQYITLKAEIDEAIANVIAEASFIRGPHVDKFERDWAKTLGINHCVSCANGTDALYIAMKGLGIETGDEVITTAHSWISTSETITQAGGQVVFCDTDADTFNIDPDLIESKITASTVGIIPVHLYGQPASMDQICRIAKKHNLWVIEDCAQAHIARFQNQYVGTFGNAATFSFYPGKNLGAYGDAGCVVTNDDKLADWMTLYARHGGKGEHLIEGINSRMDGLQAAILNVKLGHLAKWTEQRCEIACHYDQLLRGVGDVRTPVLAPHRSHAYHLYVIRTSKRDLLRKHLSQCGVATMLNYSKALPFYPAYSHLNLSPDDFPNAHRNQSDILSLPIYPELKFDEVASICGMITDFFDKQ